MGLFTNGIIMAHGSTVLFLLIQDFWYTINFWRDLFLGSQIDQFAQMLGYHGSIHKQKYAYAA